LASMIEVFRDVVARIEQVNINYLIVGSIASMVYGEPRLTRDLDLVLDIEAKDCNKFFSLFQQPEFYCPPMEILADEVRNRGQFNLLHVPSGLKIDIVVKKVTAFDQSRFSRVRKTVLWENFTANVASVEDVIIKKLEFYREGGSEKHLRDIRGIQSNTKLDLVYLEQWIAKLHLEEEWKKL
jgi:hypothetical protein